MPPITIVEPEISIKDENGLFHCENGPALVSSSNGNIDLRGADLSAIAFREGPVEMWYFHGRHHRIGGPAETFGTPPNQYWYVNGKLFEGGDTEDYWRACASFCEKHDIVTPGRSTKRAHAN